MALTGSASLILNNSGTGIAQEHAGALTATTSYGGPGSTITLTNADLTVASLNAGNNALTLNVGAGSALFITGQAAGSIVPGVIFDKQVGTSGALPTFAAYSTQLGVTDASSLSGISASALTSAAAGTVAHVTSGGNIGSSTATLAGVACTVQTVTNTSQTPQGAVNSASGTISASLVNQGTFQNLGTINASQSYGNSASLVNSGTLTNAGTINATVGGNYRPNGMLLGLNNTGTIVNTGTLTIGSNSSNSGTIQNNGGQMALRFRRTIVPSPPKPKTSSQPDAGRGTALTSSPMGCPADG